MLKNFFLIYKTTRDIDFAKIGYGIYSHDTLLYITNDGEDFYATNQSLRIEDINWITYSGVQLPVFWGNNMPNNLLCEKVEFDVISMIYYFLTGYQELGHAPSDKFGRFTYPDSIQKAINIPHVPVVDYYFLILKTALEKAFGVNFINKLTHDAPFHTIITHDVDIWARSWRRQLKYLLRQRDFLGLFIIFKKYILRKHLSEDFDAIANFQQRYRFKNTYFFLATQEQYLGLANADYDIKRPAFSEIIHKLKADGNEIGLHGSFTTGTSERKLGDEWNVMQPYDATGIRFHYLMVDSKVTPQLLHRTAVKYDSSFGFNDMPGFRHGTSYPFYLFDQTNKSATNVIEIPLMIMDASLFQPQYLGLGRSEDAFDHIQPMLDQIIFTGGCLVINWHNNSFGKANQTSEKTFDKILQYVADNGTKFCTMQDLMKVLGS